MYGPARTTVTVSGSPSGRGASPGPTSAAIASPVRPVEIASFVAGLVTGVETRADAVSGPSAIIKKSAASIRRGMDDSRAQGRGRWFVPDRDGGDPTGSPAAVNGVERATRRSLDSDDRIRPAEDGVRQGAQQWLAVGAKLNPIEVPTQPGHARGGGGAVEGTPERRGRVGWAD